MITDKTKKADSQSPKSGPMMPLPVQGMQQIRCAVCNLRIPAKRLAAVPSTRLCLTCKQLHDEPLLRDSSPLLARSLAESSLSDLAEMQKQSRELVSGE